MPMTVFSHPFSPFVSRCSYYKPPWHPQTNSVSMIGLGVHVRDGLFLFRNFNLTARTRFPAILPFRHVLGHVNNDLIIIQLWQGQPSLPLERELLTVPRRGGPSTQGEAGPWGETPRLVRKKGRGTRRKTWAGDFIVPSTVWTRQGSISKIRTG